MARFSCRADRRTVRVALALLAWFALVLPARAQFTPAAGPINTPLTMSTASSASSGLFSVTLSNKTITVTRPGLGPYTYTAGVPFGVANFQVSYEFVGAGSPRAGLVILTTWDDGVRDHARLDFLRMDTIPVGTPATNMFDREWFTTENPGTHIDVNSDRSLVFTRVILNDIPGNDVQEVRVHRADTGAAICGAGPYDRDPALDTFTAENDGTFIIIHHKRGGSFPFDHPTSCPLPDAGLAVAPSTLAFGQILSTATATQTFILSNPGTDTVTISAIGAAGPFSPQGFPAAGITLAPGASSAPITMRFNPNNVVGTWDEQAPITRTPAVGAAFVHCTGSSREPAAELTVSAGAINFGIVNIPGSRTQTFTVRNTGDLPLTLNAPVGPAAGGVFTLTPPAALAFPAAIPAGGGPHTFTVIYAPTAEVTSTDAITLNATSTNPASMTRTINLSGTGHIPSAEFTLDPTLTALHWGDVEVGYRFGKGVRIVNTGDLDLTFDAEVMGDARFTISPTPEIPGPGVRTLTGVTIPASPIGGPFNEKILRVAFDAAMPLGGPYAGTLRLSNIGGDVKPPLPPALVNIALDGSVVAGKTLDVALVLDRSGSMAEPMRVGTKEQAVRGASRLFFELLRLDVGDRAALVQFDDQADTLVPRTELLSAPPPGTRRTFTDAVANPANLTPRGSTAISKGLLAAFAELTDTARDIRAALVVTDGMENTDAVLPDGTHVNLANLTVPPGIGVHALALGRRDDPTTAVSEANTDFPRLQAIAQRTGGAALDSDDVTRLGLFDVEKFFLQVATTLLNQSTVLDPIDSIAPGQRRTWQVELLPADKSVTFALIFKHGALPYHVEAPDGTIYPAGAPPAGFGQSVSEPPNARILRISLPTERPEAYAGIWKIVVENQGFITVGEGEGRKVHGVKEPVDYAFAVSAGSNLRLLGVVSPQPLLVGDPITVTAFLTEEEIAVRHAAIDVTIRYPDLATSRIIRLHDDGLHNDGDADDGEYAADFRDTTQDGSYMFSYHAVGASARGGTFVRETVLGQHVGAVPEPPGRDKPGDQTGGDACCRTILWWLRLLAVIGVVIVLLLLRKRAAARP